MANLLQLVYVIARWSKGIPRSRSMIAVAVLTSFLAGVGYTLLIALIKRTLSEGLFVQPKLIWTFVALCLAIPLCAFASQLVLLYLTGKSSYELRVQLSRQILSTPPSTLKSSDSL